MLGQWQQMHLPTAVNAISRVLHIATSTASQHKSCDGQKA